MSVINELFLEAISSLDEDHSIEEKDRVIIAQFYAYGVCGTILNWVNEGMKTPPLELANLIRRIAVNIEKAAGKGYLKKLVPDELA